jgi:hypothetical protein
MASLTFSVANTALGSNSKSYTFTDAEIDRLIAAVKTFPGNAALTDLQALARWADWCKDRTVAMVLQIEQGRAAASAEAAVTRIGG